VFQGSLDQYRSLITAGVIPAATRLFAGEVARVPAAVLNALALAGGDEGDAAQDAADAAEAVGRLHDLEAMVADEADLRRWRRVELPVLLMQGADP
jgi:hypothetical protein